MVSLAGQYPTKSTGSSEVEILVWFVGKSNSQTGIVFPFPPTTEGTKPGRASQATARCQDTGRGRNLLRHTATLPAFQPTAVSCARELSERGERSYRYGGHPARAQDRLSRR